MGLGELIPNFLGPRSNSGIQLVDTSNWVNSPIEMRIPLAWRLLIARNLWYRWDRLSTV